MAIKSCLCINHFHNKQLSNMRLNYLKYRLQHIVMQNVVRSTYEADSLVAAFAVFFYFAVCYIGDNLQLWFGMQMGKYIESAPVNRLFFHACVIDSMANYVEIVLKLIHCSFFPLSFSFSLSRTHTHTHIEIHK